VSCFLLKNFSSRYFVSSEPRLHIPYPIHADVHDKRCWWEADLNQSSSPEAKSKMDSGDIYLQERGFSRIAYGGKFARQRCTFIKSKIASPRRCYGHLVVIYFDLNCKSCSRNHQMSLVVKQLFYQFFINYGKTN
jgi:hypothetical protein